MTEKDEQLERFREAVDRKAAAAEDASHASPARRAPGEPDPADHGIQRERVEDGRTQDTSSIRDKNAGKGKKTADKWNQ